VDLKEEIEVDVGGEGVGAEGAKKIVKLRDVMRVNGEQPQPPRVAAKYWEEYSGKQTLLSTFFGRGGAGSGAGKEAESAASKETAMVGNETGDDGVAGEQDMNVSPGRDVVPGGGSDTGIPASAPSTVVSSPDPNDGTQGTTTSSLATLSNLNPDPTPPTSSAPAPSSIPTPQQPSPPPPPPPPTKRTPSPAVPLSLAQYPHETKSTTKKRKHPDDGGAAVNSKTKPKKKQNANAGQTKLSTFFAPPSTSTSGSGMKQEGTEGDTDLNEGQDQVQLEADYQLALELSTSQESQSSSTPPIKPNGVQATTAWSHLLAPLQPPNCLIHNEPAKELTVMKAGPNKGKNFFICSRPVGPGYDRGRGERLREEVDHRWKCNFFKWASEVRREAVRGRLADVATGAGKAG
jgi:AP endonuclease 2